MRVSSLLISAISCLGFFSVPTTQALAWGALGHKVVAIIAEDHLSPEAGQAVSALLSSEGKVNLDEVASWADRMRALAIPKQPSHMVSIPLDHSAYDPEVSCARSNCVLGALKAGLDTLRNPEAPVEAKAIALNYVVHYVGDIHEPLHTSVDAGFEGVEYGPKRQSLHRIWDNSIILDQEKSARSIAEDIERHPSHAYVGGSPENWAVEGRDIARDEIFPELDKWRVNGVVTLPDNYADEKWPIVRQRLEQGGLRLAALLNGIFVPSPQASDRGDVVDGPTP